MSPHAPAGELTPQQWAVYLLYLLGAPRNRANFRALLNWAAWEGGNWKNIAYANPLNTTWTEPNSVSINSVGVQSYSSWDSGFAATVSTLHNGYYNVIVADLRAGKGQLIGSSPEMKTWGTGYFNAATHRTGLYATEGTLPAVGAPAPTPAPPKGEQSWAWERHVTGTADGLKSAHKQTLAALTALANLEQ